MRLAPLAALVAAAAVAGCGDGQRAAPAAGAPACENVVRPSILPDGMVEDLGTLAVGTRAAFHVDGPAAGFVIVSQEVGSSAAPSVLASRTRIPNAVVPTDLRAPDGTLFYDDLAAPATTTLNGFAYEDASSRLVFDAGFQPVVGALAFPGTTAGLERLRAAGEVPRGTWTFTVSDWAWACRFPPCAAPDGRGRYRVQVVKRPGPIPAAGTLDLEVYLATDPIRSRIPGAAAAAASADLARWRRSLAAYLAGAGLALGEVAFHDLPEAARRRFAPNGEVNVGSGDPCADLAQLFTTALAPRRAVHLFLADALVDPAAKGAFSVVGVDGSIPGPSGFPGTITSGAIVGLEDLGHEEAPGACAGDGPPDPGACGADRIAYVAAHEIGHWLGLFHTTERQGTFFDPLADTDRCPCRSCADPAQLPRCAEVSESPSTVVTNGQCVAGPACGGGRNLMFWLLDDQLSTGELTPEQGQIARLNPAVR